MPRKGGVLQDAHRHNIPNDALARSNKTQQQRTPTKVAAIAAANRARAAAVAAAAAAASPRDSAAQDLVQQAQAAPLVVESQRYEEWMKIATDNKITSTNTWNLALIDYFHDMTLLRNGDDNSINFQKASCTLDGCVKIWTSRVDSVATETGKLLSGLADDHGSAETAQQDDDVDDDEGEDEEGRDKKARKRTARQTATLADSFSKVKARALDLEFTVDPLFKKTSADFDEGGAGGILMNHLGCDGTMRVVFDAGDAKLSQDEDVDDPEGDDSVASLDLSALAANFLSNGLEAVEGMSLCPSLATFRFSLETKIDLDLLGSANDSDEEEGDNGPAGRLSPAHLPLPMLPDYDDDANREFGGEGYMADAAETDFFAADGRDALASEDSLSFAAGDAQHFDTRQVGPNHVVSADGSSDQMLDYFDRKLHKNWAGPEHWKMRRAPKKRKPAQKQQKEKIPFTIDFSAPLQLSAEDLFAPATSSTIRLSKKPGSKTTKGGPTPRDDLFMLPDDCRFTSASLLRLFLKPKVSLRMRKRLTAAPVAELWGGAVIDEDLGGEDLAMQVDYDDDVVDDFVVPFDTQVLNDGDEHSSALDVDDETGVTRHEDMDDVLAETQGQLKRVKVENINYAKRAKRVDVKKLKERIWRELEDVAIPVDDLPATSSYLPQRGDSEQPLVPVVTGLRKAYPKDKMDEISTSYCFICLLHLANEKGLRIQTPAVEEVDAQGLDDGLQLRKSVGGLERLRVLRALA
ncbi:hypothetical protein OIV83_006413 [Microbotryomycetes sp. JL201]|nr:hypothetical protein OIV83_006413 [Microbotryomycetes sp. JL201]